MIDPLPVSVIIDMISSPWLAYKMRKGEIKRKEKKSRLVSEHLCSWGSRAV